MLGLRMVRGMDKAAFRARYGIAPEAAYPGAILRLRDSGWLMEHPQFLRLTEAGLDFQNSAVEFFME